MRDEFQECDNYPVLDGLDQAWQLLSSHYNLGLEEEIIKRDEEVARTPLDAFRYYVEGGFYPPPEILLSIIHALDVYFTAGGDFTLEDVFYGPEEKWVGNAAARRDKKKVFVTFRLHYQMELISRQKQSRPKKSMEILAEEFFNSPFDLGAPYEKQPDIDFFLRNYRRWVKLSLSQKKGY